MACLPSCRRILTRPIQPHRCLTALLQNPTTFSHELITTPLSRTEDKPKYIQMRQCLFPRRCRTYVNPPRWTSNETCLVFDGVLHPQFRSVAVWNMCPQNWTERDVRQKCQDEDQSDLLSNLPVFDKDRDVHYRIYFARDAMVLH